MSTPPSTPPRPGPPPNPDTPRFWDALAEGRLVVQRCARCGHHQHHPRSLCTRCWGSDLPFVEVSGDGAVWTWTVVHKPGHASFADAVPYAVVIVTLAEGPRVVCTWDGPLDALAPDLPVRVGAGRSGEHVVLAARPDDPADDPVDAPALAPSTVGSR